MNIQNLTAWERLDYTKNAIDLILNKTKKGEVISNSKREAIQQELILCIGGISNFSEALTNNSVHK
ncbi:hypothetical protein FH947_001902 [Enterococcus faecalis]|uniref:hypothetical protein n=1 Tax=Enterococcus faecalis TaxID=1351 RepID=UPI0019E29984|nr:hypothetical protein [Enterococcus faecalis]EGO7832334.1 hypothetical protein [Enterococcus faecalis]EGO8121904.1 hypothetical protein [Enterococcus faecalis]EKK0978271.1 hypothetical protein [Enterococcus faecalis]EKZ0164249.1 hypothetical protein [Enterococcus faecalis]EKZ0220908.1 hypothetical protein [Enterococcus faecalis]